MSAYRPSFVSHAHVDNDLCDRYVAALRARGIDTWYDRNDAQAGHFLGSDIQRELQQRTAFVLLMTQQALDSFWVQLELQAYLGLMAQDRSRILLPVRIGPCQVPPFLNALFWIDAQAMPFDQTIDTIATALTIQGAVYNILPPLGPAPAPANCTPAPALTPTKLYNLGFRGYNIGGIELILPPLGPVPAGVFTMGSDKVHDPQALEDEMPLHPVDLGAFAIGIYPVTVAEYACAVHSKVVDAPQGTLGTDWHTQQAHADHPVVCITWNDAIAYTAWLARVANQPWRLPTEAEWEKAARGTDGRIYPWGDGFDKARCNTPESGIETTTPVASYPASESPYHVQDMAGNMWQWTSSLFASYPYRQDDGRENLESPGNRTLRGGSWDYVAKYARAAYRYSYRPDVFGGIGGLRLVWAIGPT